MSSILMNSSIFRWIVQLLHQDCDLVQIDGLMTKHPTDDRYALQMHPIWLHRDGTAIERPYGTQVYVDNEVTQTIAFVKQYLTSLDGANVHFQVIPMPVIVLEDINYNDTAKIRLELKSDLTVTQLGQLLTGELRFEDIISSCVFGFRFRIYASFVGTTTTAPVNRPVEEPPVVDPAPASPKVTSDYDPSTVSVVSKHTETSITNPNAAAHLSLKEIMEAAAEHVQFSQAHPEAAEHDDSVKPNIVADIIKERNDNSFNQSSEHLKEMLANLDTADDLFEEPPADIDEVPEQDPTIMQALTHGVDPATTHPAKDIEDVELTFDTPDTDK